MAVYHFFTMDLNPSDAGRFPIELLGQRLGTIWGIGMFFSHWLVDEKRGLWVCLPKKQQVSMMIDGINQLPALVIFYQKDIKLLWNR